ncbi:hypothetical protein [Chryseobacterium taiwanense]|uniref:hypothetical protein n=1 Tax=Chryseobacterium taiwanense TaxID=363331 RepID=UPI00103ADA9C|nr:hypothetical protein [Chryseobacterium taiwanense]
MIQFIIMLLSLAFGHNNANTATYDNTQTTVTVQSDSDPTTRLDPDGEPVGGNSGQLPPPLSINP